MYEQDIKLKFAQREIPLTLLFEITKRCNWNCDFCYANCNKGDELSDREIIRTLKEFKELGTFNVTFTGGEPFMRKNIMEILKETRSMGYAISINTNGSLIYKYDIREISKLFAEINISLHSIIPEQHDELVGHKGAWEKTVTSLKLLKKYKSNVTVNTVFTNRIKNNYLELMEFIQDELGFKWNPDMNIIPTYNGDNQFIVKYNLSIKEKEEILNLNPELGMRTNEQGEIVSNGICRGGRNFCFIDADGYLYPCLSFKQKGKDYINGIYWKQSIKQFSVEKIWRNNAMFNYLRNIKEEDFKKCKNCLYYKNCFKCMAENYINTNEPTLPSQNICERKGF